MNGTYASVVALGAGPANLALAVALEEMAPEIARETIILEQHEDVAWQRGMLLPWTQSQVSYLKDLVTLRNPRSKFSFINYLHSVGRLDGFVNLGTSTPYRLEISNYLRWVADSLDLVRIELKRKVDAVQARSTGGTVDGWRVRLAGDDTVECHDIVVGIGREPHVPAEFRDLPAERLVHSTEFAWRLPDLGVDSTRRIVVIGGAQSAAEMLWAAYHHFPSAQCAMVMRSVGLGAYETSTFTNELYYPSFVGEFFAGTVQVREQVLAEMRRTNYAGLAPGMLDELYRRMYLDKLIGEERITMHTLSTVLDARMDGDEVVLTIGDRLHARTNELRCDIVLLGTGFERGKPELVRDMAASAGLREIAVDRVYRMVVPDHVVAGCYLQGVNENSHGIADSLISVLAARSGEIATDLLARRAAEETPTLSTALASGDGTDHREDD